MCASRDDAIATFLKTRGGDIQKSTASAPTLIPSSLAAELEAGWTWGYLSPPTVRKLALAANTDARNAGYEPHPAMTKLEHVGEHGNARRGMLRAFPLASTVPRPLAIRVPCMPIKGLQ